MRIPYWMYAVGVLILAFLGFSMTKEREIKGLIKQTKAAEKEAVNAQQEKNRQDHQNRRANLERKLEHERSRPLASRIRDSYVESERRRNAGAN